MASIIECIKRTYNIQVNGIKVHVESEKPLSGALTAKLLENDCDIKDISSLLENCKIIDIEKIIKDVKDVKKKPRKKTSPSPKKKTKRHRYKKASSPLSENEDKDFRSKDKSGEPHEQPEDISGEKVTPLSRLNMLLQMQGEFTRIDYQKFIEDTSGYKMSKYMGHGDIEDALALRRIEPIGKRMSKQFVKYIVIDTTLIEEDAYKRAMTNNRMQKHKSGMIQVET